MSHIRDSWECAQVCTGLTEYSNTLPFSFSFFLFFFCLTAALWSIPVMRLRVSFKVKMQQQCNYEDTQRYYYLRSPHPTPPPSIPSTRNGRVSEKQPKRDITMLKRCRGARTCPIGSAWRVRRPSKIDEKKKKKKEKKDSSRFEEVKSCASDTLMNPHINNRANFFFFFFLSSLFFFLSFFFFSSSF